MGNFSDGVNSIFKGIGTFIKLLVLLGIFLFFGRAAWVFIFDNSGKNLEAVDVAGTYVSTSFFDSSIVLNADGTFNRYDGNVEMGRGTFEATEKRLVLQNTNTQFSDGDNWFDIQEDYYYRTTEDMWVDGYGAAFFELDTYGRNPEFDENGRSNQTFEVNLTGTARGDNVALTLNDDGTFVIQNNNVVGYEGTYKLQDKVLTLNYNEKTLIFIYDDDKIYFDVYEKQE